MAEPSRGMGRGLAALLTPIAGVDHHEVLALEVDDVIDPHVTDADVHAHSHLHTWKKPALSGEYGHGEAIDPIIRCF